MAPPARAALLGRPGRKPGVRIAELALVERIGVSRTPIRMALLRLQDPQPLQQVGTGLALSVVSSALNGGLAWLMFQSGRAHRSMALEGDAPDFVRWSRVLWAPMFAAQASPRLRRPSCSVMRSM